MGAPRITIPDLELRFIASMLLFPIRGFAYEANIFGFLHAGMNGPGLQDDCEIFIMGACLC